jgi:hypothetical protein
MRARRVATSSAALQHDVAGAGQRDLLAVAVEQLHLEGFFQRLDLGADGRLGQVQDFGGTGEAVQVRHGGESAQLRQRQHDSRAGGCVHLAPVYMRNLQD